VVVQIEAPVIIYESVNVELPPARPERCPAEHVGVDAPVAVQFFGLTKQQTQDSKQSIHENISGVPNAAGCAQ
jgi:hypothetical protein